MNFELPEKLLELEEPCRWLRFSPDGTALVASGIRLTYAIYIPMGRLLCSFAPGGHCEWLSDGYLVTSGYRNSPLVFTFPEGELIGRVTKQPSSHAVGWMLEEGGGIFAYTGFDGVTLYQRGRSVASEGSPSLYEVHAEEFPPGILVSNVAAGVLYVADRFGIRALCSKSLDLIWHHRDVVERLALDQERNHLLYADGSRYLKRLDAVDGSPLSSLAGVDVPAVWALGKGLSLACARDRELDIYPDYRASNDKQTFKLNSTILALEFDAEAEGIALACEDGSLFLLEQS